MPDCFLLITSGERAGERLDVAGELVIGREGEGAALPEDDLLSRRHARVERNGDGTLVVTDLESRNGTYVNGARLTGSQRLAPGDALALGRTTIEVRCEERGPAPVEQVGAPASSRALPDATADPPSATILVEGRRLVLPPHGLTIGRLDENDLVVPSPDASRRHARISVRDGRHYVVDLASANGTYLNGERLLDEARYLSSGDSIAIGGTVLRYVTGAETRVGSSVALDELRPEGRRFSLGGSRLTLGRDASNDICLEAPTISRFHAEVVRVDGGVELRDLASRNGTRLDGRVVQRESLQPGSEIGVGPFRLIFDGDGFLERDDRGALRLDAYEISVAIKDKLILDRASLTIQPGELVAVIGESGSGKTTLMRVLVGTSRPSHGVVLVNGEPLEARLSDIGYLPQDEIVHPRLTVLESLRYSARLRLPRDSSGSEIDAAVARVLAETSLEQQVGTRIGSLSGGQRKRVGLATELLSQPGLLFLDEPTTGLDPGLEGRMMELFKRLSSVGEQALLVVTHATRSLELADRLFVLARGGHLCFRGEPEEAKSFFDVSSYDDIYAALDSRPVDEWRHDFETGAGTPVQQLPAAAADPARLAGVTDREKLCSVAQQSGVLGARYFTVFRRDVRNVLILLLQAPLIALAMALLFKPDVFAPPGEGIASSAAQLLFVIVVTTIWLGTLASAREIIKERPVFERERAVGVSIRAYVASKLAVLFPLVAVQAAVLMVVVFGLRPLYASHGTYAALLTVLVLTGFSAVSMGLLISGLVRTEEQAMALLPVAMIVQLLFGGAIVTVASMGSVMAWLSAAVVSRWAFAGAGTVIDMNARIAGDPSFREISQYGQSFFDLSLPLTWAVLAGFTALFVGGTLLALRRSPA